MIFLSSNKTVSLLHMRNFQVSLPHLKWSKLVKHLSFGSGSVPFCASTFLFNLIQLLFKFLPVFCSHRRFTTCYDFHLGSISQAGFGSISGSIWFHFRFGSVPFPVPFGSISVSVRFHFRFRSVPFSAPFGSISGSIQFHFHSTFIFNDTL